MKHIICVVIIFFSFHAAFSQAGAESALQDESQTSKINSSEKDHSQKLNEIPLPDPVKENTISSHKKPMLKNNLMLRHRIDRDRARNFFLITLCLAVVLWLGYILIYFMTIDWTSSAIIGFGGILGVLAIPATLFAIIGFIYWMVAVSQGW